MRHPLRAGTVFLLLLTSLLAACGGDDSAASRDAETRSAETAARTATATPTTAARERATATPTSAATARTPGASSTQAANCSADVRSYRFKAKLSLRLPAAAPSPSGGSVDINQLLGNSLEDVTIDGSAVTPDRSQLSVQLGGKDSILAGQTVEMIQVGPAVYTRFGATPWQKAEDGGPFDLFTGLTPAGLCENLLRELPAGVSGKQEKLNGVDVTRYDYTGKDLPGLEQALRDFGGGGGGPADAKMTLWVANKERFPLRMLLEAQGSGAQAFKMTMETNVSDLNSNAIKIEAPR